MIRPFIDLIGAFVILGFTYFAGTGVIEFVRKDTIQHVKKGLLPMHRFSQSLTGIKFDWER